MEMCEREGLNQVDLLSPATQKITQKEYWAKRRGQEMLDQKNSEMQKEGLTPNGDVYQTPKQYIRDAIDDSLAKSSSIDEYKTLLLENYQISTTEKRGRLSYRHPDRDKPLTGRSLGSHYTKEYILNHFENKALEPDYHTDPVQILYFHSELRLVVKLQNCVKAQQSEAYAHKVKISNLQQMAKTIVYVQEHQYDTQEQLQNDLEEITQTYEKLKQQESILNTKLADINKQIHYTGQYYANKSAFINMIHTPNKSNYRSAHLKEITEYEEARAFLKSHAPQNIIPSIKDLKEKKFMLSNQLVQQKKDIAQIKNSLTQLQTIHSNIGIILQYDPTYKTKEKEAEL